MHKTTLLVRRKGTAMVPLYGSNVRRYIGWKHDANAGHEFEHPETKAIVKAGAFIPSDEPVTVPNIAEYRRHIGVDKDLYAADQETADECGVAFDPTFGEAKAAAPVVANTVARVAVAAEEH